MIHLIRSEWIKFRSVRSTARHARSSPASSSCSSPCSPPTTSTASRRDPLRARPSSAPPSSHRPTDPSRARRLRDHVCGTGLHRGAPANADLTDITGGVVFATLLFGMLGVQVIGQEYRFNTIRPTFTAAPRRLRVIVAKLIVVSRRLRGHRRGHGGVLLAGRAR